MTLSNFIPTDHLYLKPVSKADTPILFELWSNPDVTRFMNIEPYTEASQAGAMIAFFEQTFITGNAARYGIWDDHDLIGTCGYNDINFKTFKTEIGYELNPKSWGKGYATEVVGALIKDAFTNLSLVRVEAKVDPRNIPSANVLLHNQFKKEGTLRQYERIGDELFDIDLYSCINTIDVLF